MPASLSTTSVRPVRFIAGMAVAMAMAACGYKGPLYLPPPPPPDAALTTPPAPNPAATAATDDQSGAASQRGSSVPAAGGQAAQPQPVR
jgi:predicted small lipoprotein YifL